MDAAVTKLVSDSGALLHVTGEQAPPDRFRELTFVFANGTLVLRCNDDTDQIVLSANPANTGSSTSRAPVLDELVGMQIDYAWDLRNHRG